MLGARGQDGKEPAPTTTLNSTICCVTLNRPRQFQFPTQQNGVTARSMVTVISGAVQHELVSQAWVQMQALPLTS